MNRGPALGEILGKIWLACDCATRHSDARLENLCCSTTIIGHIRGNVHNSFYYSSEIRTPMVIGGYTYCWLPWRYIWSLLMPFDACETLHTESKFYIIIYIWVVPILPMGIMPLFAIDINLWKIWSMRYTFTWLEYYSYEHYHIQFALNRKFCITDRNSIAQSGYYRHYNCKWLAAISKYGSIKYIFASLVK